MMELRAALLWTTLALQASLLSLLIYSEKTPTLDSEDTSKYKYSVVLTQFESRAESPHRDLRSPNCKEVLCEWRKYRSNARFNASLSPFDIYEDESFTLPDKESPLYCRPDNFGYTVEEGEEVFPRRNYPTCRSKFPQYQPALFFVNNTLVMNCSGQFRGKFVLGDRSFNGTILLQGSFVEEARRYTGPVELDGEEWALGTCDEHNENLFEQVAIRVVADPSLIVKQKGKTQSVYQEAIRKFGSHPASKTIVMLLTVDSASRRHFYRKMPETVAFLKTLNGNRYHVADFLLHNIIGDNSARNQIPLLNGEARIVSKSIKELEGTQEALFHGDALGNRSIFKYASDRGFVTMLSFEFCHQYFATYIGDQPAVHHLMANFWCGAKKFAGFNFEKSVLGQRCLGPRMSHVRMMEYIEQFTRAYFGLNQLIYTHITTGHEASGTQIETLDSDMVVFLKRYLRLAERGGYSVAVILHGDHGMRYGEWYKNIAAFQEHRLPALFTIVPRELMNRMAASYDVVEHNRKRLVGKLDLYLTAKSLILLSFLPDLTRDNIIYESWKTNDLEHSVSIFLTKITNARSCSDAHIPSFYCACMRMEQIKPEILSNTTMRDLRSIVNAVVSASLAELNLAGHTGSNVPLAHVCQRLTFRGINSIFAQRVSAKDEAFKVEFSVNEHPSARFETYTIVGTSQKHVGVKANQEGFLPEGGFFRGRRKMIRIIFLKRLDSYSGFCEEVAFERAINAAFCVCQPASVLARNEPGLVTHLLRDVEFIPGTDANCSQVCLSRNKQCDTPFFELLTDPTFVQSMTKAVSCERGNFTGVSDERCVVSLEKGSCSDTHSEGFALVCPCR